MTSLQSAKWVKHTDLNEFLKPSRNICALTALLFILFVPFITYDNGIRCIRAPCPASDTGSLLAFAIFSPTHLIYQASIPIAIAGLVMSYFAACALVQWKAQLKPTLKKLALAIVFLVILTQLIFQRIEYWVIPSLGLSCNWVCDDRPCPYQDVTMYVALAAVVSYLLACAAAQYLEKKTLLRRKPSGVA